MADASLFYFWVRNNGPEYTYASGISLIVIKHDSKEEILGEF